MQLPDLVSLKAHPALVIYRTLLSATDYKINLSYKYDYLKFLRPEGTP